MFVILQESNKVKVQTHLHDKASKMALECQDKQNVMAYRNVLEIKHTIGSLYKNCMNNRVSQVIL